MVGWEFGTSNEVAMGIKKGKKGFCATDVKSEMHGFIIANFGGVQKGIFLVQ